MDQCNKKHAVMMHQRAKTIEIIEHEKKMNYFWLDRSHYKRAELQLYLAHLRYQMQIKNSPWMRKNLRWSWQVTYMQLKFCFKSPLPKEANIYCRWV